MTQSAYPFDTIDTTEAQFSAMFSELIETGVLGTGNELQVSADASGMNVKVQPGTAFIRGFFFSSDALVTLPVTASDSTARVDRVVVRIDTSANVGQIAVVKGALTQNATVWEEPIAAVNVAGSAVTIAAADVTDQRSRTGKRVGFWPTTALRPAGTRRGQIGFNGQTLRWEQYQGPETGWTDLLAWANISGKPTSTFLDGRSLTSGTALPTTVVNGDFFFKRSA